MKQGRFPCGRMFSVQSGLELWATPTSSMCLQWCLQVPAFLGYLHFGRIHFGRTHIWILLVALIIGFIGPQFWIYGQLSGSWISVILKVCLENLFCYEN